MSPTLPSLTLDASVSTAVSAGSPASLGPVALPLTAGGLAFAAAVATGGLMLLGGIAVYAFRSSDERVDRVADALDGDLPAPTDAPVREGADVPADAGLHEVATHDDGAPVYVPVVRIPLATTDPGMDGVYRHAAAAVAALHDEFDDAHVRGYDVDFGLDDGSLGGIGRTVKRVAVPPALAERLRDPDYDHRDLRGDVAERDDGDPGVPPVDWGEPLSYAGGGGSAAAATAATT
ncbi:hypothetical protein ABNG02_15530 [Halorubrum ejinorense]|uniref:Uncharacterized protein n=1 Tax=Halorubrum ejinorense TaxID=425309 RepID=A0AAV3SRU4_9EURY